MPDERAVKKSLLASLLAGVCPNLLSYFSNEPSNMGRSVFSFLSVLKMLASDFLWKGELPIPADDICLISKACLHMQKHIISRPLWVFT